MRLWHIFLKSMREQSRDLLVLSLTLVFAPLFVFLYWVLFPSGSTTYGVLVINNDRPVQAADGARLAAGEQVLQAVREITYTDGKPLLILKQVTDRAQAEKSLRDRKSTILLILPPEFSAAVEAVRTGQTPPDSQPLTFVGDLTNPQYAVAVVLVSAALDEYLGAALNQPNPVPFLEQPLGGSATRSEFETYVPGLFVFAIIIMIFQAAMTVAREVESGGLRRLQLTPMRALDYLGGVSASLVLVGVVSVGLTYLTALAVGFRSQGPLWVALLVSVLTSVAIIGMGLLIACFSRNVTQAFLIANFPLALLMFFSGSIFPVPNPVLFSLGERAIGLFDILPPTHAVVALNKVFTLGAGAGEVVYEMAALAVLSLLYFALGVWLFQRRQLRGG